MRHLLPTSVLAVILVLACDAADPLGTADDATVAQNVVVTPAGTVTVTETIIGVLGTGTGSGANAINEKGQVVGWSETGSSGTDRHAFLWDNGTLTDLGTAGGSESFAYDINAKGLIVGQVWMSTGVHGFVYDGVMQPLPNPTGYESCAALSINNAGLIAGACASTSGPALPQRAVTWKDGVVTEVADPVAPTTSRSYAVNHSGQLGGSIVAPGSVWQPTIWKSGTPGLLTVPTTFAGGNVDDLNAKGEAAGYVFSQNWAPVYAVRWSNKGVPTLIEQDGSAEAINDNGEVVGRTSHAGVDAFFWSPDTGIVPMANGVWAFDINNSRVAVGEAYVGGSFVAAVWTITITP
jgi:probable HAF family extracellular repeat protein